MAVTAQKQALNADCHWHAGANGLASLMLQCLWESFALPVIVNPLVAALGAKQAQPSEQDAGEFSCMLLSDHYSSCFQSISKCSAFGSEIVLTVSTTACHCRLKCCPATRQDA